MPTRSPRQEKGPLSTANPGSRKENSLRSEFHCASYFTVTTQQSPDAILQTAFSFWSSKVLLTAVEFGLFTRLGNRRLTGAELGAELKLHPRGIADFFDALVAMKFLARDGDGPGAKYFNTPDGLLFLDEK